MLKTLIIKDNPPILKVYYPEDNERSCMGCLDAPAEIQIQDLSCTHWLCWGCYKQHINKRDRYNYKEIR